MKVAHIYKAHRIHVDRLPSGRWVSLIVNLGARTTVTKNALTESVTRIPDEYESEDRAVQAARAYIDEVVQTASEELEK